MGLERLRIDYLDAKRNFGCKGDGVTDDTSALQAAANSGAEVVLPAGTYLISGTIKFAPYTRFKGIGSVTIKTTVDTNLIQLVYKNKIIGVDIDISAVTFTHDVIEISSATMQGASSWDWKVDIWIEKMTLILNNPSMPPQGTMFHIWAAKNDPNTSAVYTNIGFWGVTIKDIDVKGYLGFFCRNYAYQSDGTSNTGWLTGVAFENCNLDSVRYGFLGCDTEANIGNLNYMDCGNMVIDNVQLQCNGSKYFAYFSHLDKTIKNSIPWDWQKSNGTPTPFLVQYRSDSTYMNQKIYIDYGYGPLSSVFSVNGAPSYMSSSELNNWLRYSIAKYNDVFNDQHSSLMNAKSLSISGSQTMPAYIKVCDYTTNLSQFTAGFLMNMSYYAGNFGVVGVTLTVADSAPTVQATNPVLTVVTTPFVPTDKSVTFFVSKTVQSDGNTTYKIYMELITNTLGAGFYWAPFSLRGQYTAPAYLELLASAPSETLIQGTLKNVQALPTLASAPAAHAGYMYYDTGSNQPIWTDGTTWYPIPEIDHGSITSNATAGSATTVTFNRSFRGTPTVTVTPRSTTTGITVSTASVTNTGFTLYCSTASTAVDWIAVE